MHDIVRGRLRNQFLEKRHTGTAAELVAWMGAVQAQEYEHARWGLGLRLAGSRVADAIESEISAGRILRTHVMRPTWHFVVAEDLRWMQALTSSRVHSRMAPYNRRLELDAKTMTRAMSIIERALGDGACLTRAELGDALRRARIVVTPLRLAHIAMHAELECVVCSGPRRDRQFTYALVSSRASLGPRLARDEALGELARRFFQSHGPATVRDFVWWSGLTTLDARRGADIVRASVRIADGRHYYSFESAQPASRAVKAVTAHMLPIYDEYLVAYRDREVVPHRPTTIMKNGRVVGFQHAIVIGGQVAGTWRTDGRGGAATLAPMRRLTAEERESLAMVVRRYSRFVAR
ncbi:MAG TPA: winged helix DNA-binding domain-containing protein [Vicinamibacterales bacterium]|nr:winged helix DNA-binding domain-containing protein [Vicinamibacterales bacterium]